MPQPTFTTPDLSSFCLADSLGLTVTGQHVTDREAVLECRVLEPDDWCHQCGSQGIPRGTVLRPLAHVPYGSRPTVLHVRVRRYRCTACGHVWRQDTTSAARPRAKLSRTALAWGLRALVVDHRSILSIARDLKLSWTATNEAILAEGQRRLINDPHRFDGVSIIGVDEHVWRHTSRGEKYVTVVIDLTPIRDGTGPARLLDMVQGRSKNAFATWLAARDPAWRDGIEIVAMDGFTGFKTAAAEQLPDAVEVMDPFHVVKLAGDCLDTCRQRLQQAICGHRGRVGDPLYKIRKLLHTGADLLTEKTAAILDPVLADTRHAALLVTWEIYQAIIAAYRHPKRPVGKKTLADVIATLRRTLPPGLDELARLGRTLNHRAGDILAFFDHPGSSNGPTEAINGRLEHLRGIALGFQNLTHYITRSLLEAGGFRNQLLHPQT